MPPFVLFGIAIAMVVVGLIVWRSRDAAIRWAERDIDRFFPRRKSILEQRQVLAGWQRRLRPTRDAALVQQIRVYRSFGLMLIGGGGLVLVSQAVSLITRLA
ncbi:hypothetical protein SAMN05444157_3591 [Frankineae bacterium MT45]|nr:hypothetical protein SAMN05444157_3591 [Frankineae bacterium MT45]